MYIIAGLGMLVLYQQRHPDINANAYAAFATFAMVIFIALMGVVSHRVTLKKQLFLLYNTNSYLLIRMF